MCIAVVGLSDSVLFLVYVPIAAPMDDLIEHFRYWISSTTTAVDVSFFFFEFVSTTDLAFRYFFKNARFGLASWNMKRYSYLETI